MFRPLVFVLLLILPLPVAAQAPVASDGPARIGELIDALRLGETLEIMAQEGIAYGDELEAEMFPGRGGARWKAMVNGIYDRVRAEEVMREALAERLAGTDLDPLIAFFASDAGARIVGLEVSARKALLDPGIEEASRQRVEEMRARDDPLLPRLEAFIAANDLVEMNVVGGLNANFAFYTGLVDGGAFSYAMSEEEMLAEVWSQEAEVRDETESWLYAYLAMAYEPLDAPALDAYQALSETPEGLALNLALFDGFDILFRQVSRELGLGAAQFISGQDI